MRPYRPMRTAAGGSDMRVDVRGDFFFRIGFQGPASREMRGLHSGHERAVLGRDDIAKAIRALTLADWIRLNKVAVAYSTGRLIEPNDLLQEAFARAMDGRHCPADVTVVKFLAEAMRSIAHGEGEKVEHRLVLVSASGSEETGQVAFAFPDASPNAEQRMVSDETVAEVRSAILALFTDDEHAQVIAEGLMDGIDGEELRALCELEATAYNSKRRLVRRRIEKAYPEGWKL
jgi:DNA-directed RNA polymerase specialized sigma24 family protein